MSCSSWSTFRLVNTEIGFLINSPAGNSSESASPAL
jgi:hypothetical protein